MERITVRGKSGKAIIPYSPENNISFISGAITGYGGKVIDYLAEIEDKIESGELGDIRDLTVKLEVEQRDKQNLERTLEETKDEWQAEKKRADIAERAFDLLCKQANEDTESYGYCSTYNQEDFYERAEKELQEDNK